MRSPKTREEQQVRLLMSVLPGTYEEAQTAARWLLKQSLELQVWAKQKSKERYYLLKGRHDDIKLSLLSIAADLIVAFEIKDSFMKKHRKNKAFESDDIILMELFEENMFAAVSKRAAPKEAYLQRRKLQILKWREMGASYRKIAARLETPDGETISSEKIRKFVNMQGKNHGM